MELLKKIQKNYLGLCQKIGAVKASPTEKQYSTFLLFMGVVLLGLGSVDIALANNNTGQEIRIDENRFRGIICAITQFLEGSFGALIMVISGIGAIVSAAFGQYKAAIGLLVVAVGAFILRSLVSTFFGREIYADCSYIADLTEGPAR